MKMWAFCTERCFVSATARVPVRGLSPETRGGFSPRHLPASQDVRALLGYQLLQSLLAARCFGFGPLLGIHFGKDERQRRGVSLTKGGSVGGPVAELQASLLTAGLSCRLASQHTCTWRNPWRGGRPEEWAVCSALTPVL